MTPIPTKAGKGMLRIDGNYQNYLVGFYRIWEEITYVNLREFFGELNEIKWPVI